MGSIQTQTDAIEFFEEFLQKPILRLLYGFTTH